MALNVPGNVTVDIYRGGQAIGGNPAVPGVKGYLKPVVQTGRHGTALYLRWTHILFVSNNVDVRDGYNSQLNALQTGSADVVVVKDATHAGNYTKFFVVYVEAVLRGSGASHLRVYLDRYQPQSWPTDAL